MSNTNLRDEVKENDFVCILNSNGHSHGFENTTAFGIVEYFHSFENENVLRNLNTFISNTNRPIFGFVSYDLKNDIEDLSSNNPESMDFPTVLLVSPQKTKPLELDHLTPSTLPKIKFEARVSREEYITKVESLQEHIRCGDFYEINYCIEFYAEDIRNLDMFEVYLNLNKLSPVPFSSFIKYKEFFIASASPERFLKKTGNKLISQPIKGTARRNITNLSEDEKIKNELLHSPKERAENLMIVDLVRNDLNRCSTIGSVKVDELFGIYSFPQVHQMISTISCTLKEDISFVDILKNTFPMGSMTGAPKIKTMEMIEKYENSRRGVFSGTIGHIKPNQDFDFNVVIRSIFYNAKTGTLSFQVGSAITLDSNPVAEYEECLLKAKAILEIFS